MDILSINLRDPFVLLENDVYYLFGTTVRKRGEELNFICYKSQDLIEFTGPYIAFEPSEVFWADSDFWAPEVHKYNGRFYMFASFKSSERCRGTQILVSDTPEGPYVPIAKEPYTPPTDECLDGTFFIEDGVPYSIYAHEWVQIKDGTFCIVTLSDDLKKTVTEPVKILTASEAPWVTSIKNQYGENCFVTDGAFIHKMLDGSLIMVWSSFSQSGYSIGQAKSVSGVMGPWTHIDLPLFTDDGGHGMIFKDLNGQLILTFHQPNNSYCERPYFFEIEERNGVLALK